MYIRLPCCLRATLLPGTCVAEFSATSAELNLYERASSNRNAAYSQQHLATDCARQYQPRSSQHRLRHTTLCVVHHAVFPITITITTIMEKLGDP
jgi:hypothetical protein